MVRGTVRWFDSAKGFGYISQDNGDDVLVRAESVESADAFQARQKVEFETVVGRSGPQAVKVTVLAVPNRSMRREDTNPSARKRVSPEVLHGTIEDLIKLLETSVQPELRRGRRPEPARAARIAEALRAIARDLA